MRIAIAMNIFRAVEFGPAFFSSTYRALLLGILFLWSSALIHTLKAEAIQEDVGTSKQSEPGDLGDLEVKRDALKSKARHDPWRKNALRSGVSFGGAFGHKAMGSHESHDLLIGEVEMGWIATDTLAKEKWFGGHLEVVGELVVMQQIHPENAYLVGINPLLRYNFVRGAPFVPFVEGGVGFNLTDIDEPDLGGVWQFSPQAGMGLEWFIKDNVAMTLKYRFLHISNASIEEPNRGVNSSAILAGVSVYF